MDFHYSKMARANHRWDGSIRRAREADSTGIGATDTSESLHNAQALVNPR